MTDFHQRLRQLRKTRHLAQTWMAELLGISPRVDAHERVGRKETNGEASIHKAELHRLYEEFDQL